MAVQPDHDPDGGCPFAGFVSPPGSQFSYTASSSRAAAPAAGTVALYQREDSPMPHALIAAIAAAALFAAVPAAAQVSADYSATSTSSKLSQSCKDFAVSSGSLSAKCNKVVNNAVDSVESTTLNLTTYISCHNNTSEPFWTANASDTNHSPITSGEIDSVAANSTGTGLLLKATCSAKGNTQQMDLLLGMRLKNDTANGALAHSSSNLIQ